MMYRRRMVSCVQYMSSIEYRREKREDRALVENRIRNE